MLLLVALVGCSGQDSPPAEAAPEDAPSELLDGRALPATARPEILAQLREDEAALRSPADGGGRATLTPTDPVPAGGSGAWTITYVAGPLGIAAGGTLVLQVSPFWGWSDPQLVDPRYPGYTRVETDAPGTRLEPTACGSDCLRVGVSGEGLPPGDRVRIHYGGEGAGAARADRFAEAREEFFLRVDGDGDGVTAPVANPPTLDVVPGPAEHFHAVLPSRARLGDAVTLRVGALDAVYDAAVGFEGELEVMDPGGLDGLPERVVFGAAQGGHRRLEAVAARPGVTRVRLRSAEGVEAVSNPLAILPAEAPPPARIVWADLHGHTGLSDGTGTPEDYLRYARDFAGLDAVAITDHDHWGLRFVDRTPALWEEIRDAVARFNDPGRFVAILGYEWTSWIFGHRHVLYFADEGPVFGSTDRDSDEPEELWARLAGLPALTVPHHPGGGPIPVDWSIPPDPTFEPLVEIVSVHGSSECSRCPAGIYAPVEGSFVRDALGRGYRLGIIGSGDTHDGHPGLGAPENGTIGLAAIRADSLDRDALLAALRARRTYATSGPRIILDFEVSGTPMGGVLRVPEPTTPRTIRLSAIGSAPLASVDVIKNGEIAFHREGDGRAALVLAAEDTEPVTASEYLYVRVVQEDGGLAWSSPVWVETAP